MERTGFHMTKTSLITIWLIIVLILLSGCTPSGEKNKSGKTLQEQFSQLIKEKQDLENQLNDLMQEYDKLKESNDLLKKENDTLQQRIEIENSNKEIMGLYGLVRVQDIDKDIVIDLRYATENNFTGKKIYPVSVCLLTRETAEKLKNANREFKKNGYRIKVWDAYRPLYVQQLLWDAVEDHRYVADPKKGSKHNRGTAVDVTLVDKEGKELVMPTGFDDFSNRASRNYSGMSDEARKNMKYLTDVMKRNGFITINSEWWHFDDSNWSNYPLLNVHLDKFDQ